MSATPNPPPLPPAHSAAPLNLRDLPRGVRVSRVDSPGGRLIRVGIGGSATRDLYHALITTSWPRFLGLIAVAYLVVNVLFACAYWAVGGIENYDGSFRDAFFFSVETFGTIGYGKMSPVALAPSLLMTVESMSSLISTALMTGLVFAKFARPTARILWSDVLAVGRRDGVPTLMFRIANERSNNIVEASFRFTMLVDEQTAEGERLRRLHDLDLVRSSTPLFTLTFTAMHRITADSPLYGKTPEQIAAMRPQFVCSLQGMDDSLNATVHARKTYDGTAVRWGARFVDILSPMRDGARVIDYRRFHEVMPDGAGESQGKPAGG